MPLDKTYLQQIAENTAGLKDNEIQITATGLATEEKQDSQLTATNEARDAIVTAIEENATNVVLENISVSVAGIGEADAAAAAPGDEGTLSAKLRTLTAQNEETKDNTAAAATALGAPDDAAAAGDGSVIGLLKQLRTVLGSQATAANQGTIISGLGALITAIETGYIADPASATGQAAIVAAVEAVTAKLIAAPATQARQEDIITRLGETNDAAATGNGSAIGILKQIRVLLTETRPGGSFAAVVPADGSDLAGGACRAVMVLTDGVLEFRGADEVSGSHTIPVLAGQMWPIRVIRILEDTTATVLAVY